MLNFNRVLRVLDYEDQDYQAVAGRLFPNNVDTLRKQWEIVQAVRAYEQFVPVKRRGTARVLGVGAGKEHTLFWLTNHAAEVHGTDIYANAGVWGSFAPQAMLTDPVGCSPYPMNEWQPNRLIVQHMDGRTLRYPDNHFDFIFSSGSIEHFGDFADVEEAAREIGRVLKPGGVASISTEFKVNDAPGDGWQGVLLFTPETLRQYIIAPSTLSLVDEPVWETDDMTRAKQHLLTDWVAGRRPIIEGTLLYANYQFTSVHLTLRK